MGAQDVIIGSRLAHVRELKAEIERLKAENARLRNESAALRAHFDLALLAEAELRGLPEDGRMIVVDGWNQILGSKRTASSRDGLKAGWQAHLDSHPHDRVWIVFDGPRENSLVDGRLRLSYTGGEGAHRADRFICDFLRLARFLGLADRVEVVTDDRDFAREVLRLADGGKGREAVSQASGRQKTANGCHWEKSRPPHEKGSEPIA